MDNHFSQRLSQHLSSLAPGFEGHWYWYSEYEIKGKKKIPHGKSWVMCTDAEAGGDSIGEFTGMRICPAWQVEDMLRNIGVIANVIKTLQPFQYAEKIVWLYSVYPDTAYQKIEEYLWSVLT